MPRNLHQWWQCLELSTCEHFHHDIICAVRRCVSQGPLGGGPMRVDGALAPSPRAGDLLEWWMGWTQTWKIEELAPSRFLFFTVYEEFLLNFEKHRFISFHRLRVFLVLPLITSIALDSCFPNSLCLSATPGCESGHGRLPFQAAWDGSLQMQGVGGTKMPMGQWGSVSSIFWGQGFWIKRFVYFGQNVVAFWKMLKGGLSWWQQQLDATWLFFCVGLRFSTWKDAILLPTLQVSVVPEVQTIEGCSAGGESSTFSSRNTVSNWKET